MEAKFSIIKKSWIWISLWVVLTILSWVFFLWNVRYSEEFTSWVSLWVQWNYATQEQKASIEKFLETEGYEKVSVYLDYDWETTVVKVQTEMTNDEEVSALSNDIKWYLMDQKIIETTDDIVQQKITWPSVWEYMKHTTVRALIIWLIFIVIYLLFSFASIRNYVSPASLWLVVIATTIFDISLPAW
jgi:preprotein translocase subunit SecF